MPEQLVAVEGNSEQAVHSFILNVGPFPALEAGNTHFEESSSILLAHAQTFAKSHNIRAGQQTMPFAVGIRGSLEVAFHLMGVHGLKTAGRAEPAGYFNLHNFTAYLRMKLQTLFCVHQSAAFGAPNSFHFKNYLP